MPIAAFRFARCLASACPFCCECLLPQEYVAVAGSDTHPPDFLTLLSFAQRASLTKSEPSRIRQWHQERLSTGPESLDLSEDIVINETSQCSVRYFVQYDDQHRVQHVSVGVSGPCETSFYALPKHDCDCSNCFHEHPLHTVREPDVNCNITSQVYRWASEMFATLSLSLREGWSTTVTGHSVGGAVAAVVAMMMVRKGFLVDQVVTFGAPMFTDGEGARKFRYLPLVRVVVSEDPVVDFPPPEMENPEPPRRSTSGEYLDNSSNLVHFGVCILLLRPDTPRGRNRYCRIQETVDGPLVAPSHITSMWTRHVQEWKLWNVEREIVASSPERKDGDGQVSLAEAEGVEIMIRESDGRSHASSTASGHSMHSTSMRRNSRNGGLYLLSSHTYVSMVEDKLIHPVEVDITEITH